MKRLSLTILLLCACLLPLTAQQMSVLEFARLKGSKVEKDKNLAILDLVTEESGFTFTVSGNTAVEPEAQNGFIRLRLPHKTSYLTVQHQEFGHLTWMVPNGKKLRKHNHYQAVLVAVDPTKDYKSPKQWVVFHLDPEDVLLQVDSTIKPVRSRVAEYYLPVGKHSYRVEAPFYSPQEGEFTLTDSSRTDIPVHLQPVYSYLTVKTEWQGGQLYIDGAHIRREDATSLRLGEGYHRLSYFWADMCFLDSLVYMGSAQKKVVELKVKDLYPRENIKLGEPYLMSPQEETDEPGAQVKLIAADTTADIWVDRERVAQRQWEGRLSAGFHLAQTVSGGKESAPVRIWVENGIPQEISLPASGTGYGILNIHSNVDGAGIMVDGKYYGQTPQLLRVDAAKSYQIVLVKDGYKPASRQVRPRSNNQIDVNIKLKKQR